jgi:hypothetical protein
MKNQITIDLGVIPTFIRTEALIWRLDCQVSSKLANLSLFRHNKAGRERKTMRKYISAMVFGFVGACAGFTICFVYLVLPTREPLERGQEAQRAMLVFSHLSLSHDAQGKTYFTIP